MAIVARSNEQLDAAEIAAVRKFFENSALFREHQVADATALEDFMSRWGVVFNDESLAVALQKLSEAGVIKLKTDAQLRYEQVAQDFTPHQQKTVMDWLKSRRLIATPGTDEAFTNAAEILSTMRGRDFTISNLDYCMNYCLRHGTTLYRAENPRQNPWHDRAHKAVSPEDYRFAPKEDTNRGPLSRHSHSSNPAFNGELDRQKREKMNKHLPDSSDAAVSRMNAMWLSQAQALRGNTHSETARIQAVVAQTPGDGHAAYKAGVAEQKRIERERSRAR